MTIGIINGPNLNLLGKREKGFYGDFSLVELQSYLRKKTPSEIKLIFFQSNHEGEIVEYIHEAPENKINFLVVNAAAYTHTSIAIRDSLLVVNLPFIEVHLSNVHQRENFRHHSLIADVAKGVISGLGREGYWFAIEYFIQYNLDQKKQS